MSIVFLCSSFGGPFILLGALLFFAVVPLVLIAISIKYGFCAKS